MAKGLGSARVSADKMQNVTTSLLDSLKKLMEENQKKAEVEKVILFTFPDENPICAGKTREMSTSHKRNAN